MKKLRNMLVICIAMMLVVGNLCAGIGTARADGDNELVVMSNRTYSAEAETIVKKVEAAYDGKINWLDSGEQKVNLLFATGEYGDVIIGHILQDMDVSLYAANGLLIPLDDYINEELTPNLCKMFEEHPSAKAVATWTDGHIYALPRFYGIEAESCEDMLFINKTWLDKLNLEVPTTTEELYDVLKAFKTGDPNGNGQADEIPFILMNNSGYNFIEEMMGCWGVPTKHGQFDSFMTVKDGEVRFAPVLDEWKEMIKWYNRLYTEGLLDAEVFTQDYGTYNAKLETGNVGLFMGKRNTLPNKEDYICIPPVHAPGYEVAWRMHPGFLGVKNNFSITDHCKDIEGAMKWVDTFYDKETTLETWYGPVGEVFEVKDGMYHVIREEEKTGWTYQYAICANMDWPGVFNREELGTLLEPLDFLEEQMSNFETYYKPYVAKELWPRPYYDEETANRMSELRTDIFSAVEMAKASWITGETNIDDEWDSYVDNLYAMDLQEMIDLNQKAYDVYNEAYNAAIAAADAE